MKKTTIKTPIKIKTKSVGANPNDPRPPRPKTTKLNKATKLKGSVSKRAK
jgi:hypothetical protein